VTSLPAGVLPSDDGPVAELPVCCWPGGEPPFEPPWPAGELLADEAPQEMPEMLARAGVFPAGFGPRSQAQGAGFACGGTADRVPPGPVLAGLAQDVWDAGLERLNDDQLIGVMLAWRRLASWAGAGELAAVAELDRRRHAQVTAGADAHVAEHVSDEVAAALTLTGAGADRLVELAARLSRLPRTRAALAGGLIDQRKAAVIADEMSALGAVAAAAAEHLVLPDAPGQTTGQLRVAVKRAVAFMDPAALATRREQAVQEARVEVWGEPAGTAALAGRDLPAASVLAASKHLTALAQQLKDLGVEGTLDQLRAHAYTALLLGQSPAGLLAQAQPASEAIATELPPPTDDQPSAPADPARLPAGLGGSVNVTMPLATLLGGSHEPGEVPGYGLLPASDCRTLATAMTAPGKTRWCLTLTGSYGQPLAHGCATATAGPPTTSGNGSGNGSSDWAITFTIRPLATTGCGHQRESASYRPPPSLRHLITIRQRTCSFPGCRRPATRCDLDHTIAYHAGGRTCECNLAPLCRRHHQAKQAHGWHLEQPQPGILIWATPHRRKYVVRPGPYP
jgi:Domain of unknown function (DUF222)